MDLPAGSSTGAPRQLDTTRKTNITYHSKLTRYKLTKSNNTFFKKFKKIKYQSSHVGRVVWSLRSTDFKTSKTLVLLYIWLPLKGVVHTGQTSARPVGITTRHFPFSLSSKKEKDDAQEKCAVKSFVPDKSVGGRGSD
jgi:hypothetical protein